MGEKLINTITGPFIRILIAAVIIMAALLLCYDWRAGVCAFLAGLMFVAFVMIAKIKYKTWVNTILEDAVFSIDESAVLALRHHPSPLCIVDSNDTLLLVSDVFKDLYPDTKSMVSRLKPLTGIKDTSVNGSGNKRITVKNHTYEAVFTELNSAKKTRLVSFIDVTEYEGLKHIHADEQKCIAHVQIDNYDALISSSPDDKKSMIAASIEKAIRGWASSLEASILRYYTSKFLIIFDHKYYDKIIANKFSILDEVRNIETDADFPVSLSIGVGVGGESPAVTDGYSTFALDLALGRGGDQAVVKNGPTVDYYGGSIQVIERRNKGKSRVVAHALKQIIEQSPKVIIMGHRFPDIDSFASAIGIAKVVMNLGKDAHIIINEVPPSLVDYYNSAVKKGVYSFLTSENALEIVDLNTLLIVVDTNKPTLTETPKLIGKTEKLVVFDHHRKTTEQITNVTLTFLEPSASSTSELITEVIQFISDKKSITRFEAELLLSGITVDTNSFSIKTGMRTFEAAAWLRGKGADTTAVRQYLQSDLEIIRQKAEIIGKADFIGNNIAISKNYGKSGDIHVINAQAADGLLDIKGMKASFVIGATKTETIISARSLGEVNVQKIMEKLGGGGHLTMAAAQLKNVTIDEAEILLRKVISSV